MDSSTGGAQIQRKLLFEFWRSTSSKCRVEQMVEFVKSTFVNLAVNIEDEKQLKDFLKNECEKFRVKWLKKHRRIDLFLNAYEEWLSENLVFAMFYEQSPKPDSSIGRPSKSFEDSSHKTKKRKIEALLKEWSAEEIAFAAQVSVRASGKRDAANLIQEVSTASPRRATGYKTARRRITKKQEKRPYTPDEALSLCVANDINVNSYKDIQQGAKSRGFSLYPCYDKVSEAKKRCYPSVENIILTDIHAEVNLQALLNHTATRICQDILGEALIQSDANDKYTLIYKWGCDGSSGHSLYKQAFENEEDTDEYMFIVSLVPMRLVRDSGKKIIWENPRPSSPRFFRPVKFIYKKETEHLIRQECDEIKKQITALVPTVMQIKDGSNIMIQHELLLSMIDGKVCNVLSENRSSQKCFICQASPKEMNLKTIPRNPNEEFYRFGISCLHAYLRTMECLLNISYRLEICEWQVRGNNKKEMFRKRKEEVQKKFKSIGLIIDKVKPGFGTSNDGNTARRFFNDYLKTATITGIDEKLILRLGTILAVMASGYEIDTQKFQRYCDETRELYISLYPWYYMPATLHKLLVHGAEIIKNCIIPIGQMTEEASEAKNKEIRKVRLGHTVKISRVHANYDLMKYLLISSDPYITTLKKLPKKSTLKRKFDITVMLKY